MGLLDSLYWTKTRGREDGRKRSFFAMLLDPVGVCIQPSDDLEPWSPPNEADIPATGVNGVNGVIGDEHDITPTDVSEEQGTEDNTTSMTMGNVESERVADAGTEVDTTPTRIVETTTTTETTATTTVAPEI